MKQMQEANMRSVLSSKIVFLILQYLNEAKFKETAHMLERESRCFFNMDFFKELVLDGNWKETEQYLSSFTKWDDNKYSKKIFFEIRKQKYLEALDVGNHAKATDILLEELKIFAPTNEQVFKDLTCLLTMNNFRAHARLGTYKTAENARSLLITELKKLLQANPIFHQKLQFPNVADSQLRNLITQSLNCQHMLCQNAEDANAEMGTLFVDHKCKKQVVETFTQPSSRNLPNRSTSHREGFSQMAPNLCFQPVQQLQTSCNMCVPNLPNVSHPTVPEGNLGTPANPVELLRGSGDSNDTFSRGPSGISDRVILAPNPCKNRTQLLKVSDKLPTTVVRILNLGLWPTSMDFHPLSQALLLVGSYVGDIGLWEVSSGKKLFSTNFQIWDANSVTMELKSAFFNDPCAAVKRVRWSPDGSFFGVTYSKHVLHLYSYFHANHIRKHLEIDSHTGSVNDLAFVRSSNQLSVITCSDDKTIKVWDVVTGAKLFTFEGHEAPVIALCPHVRDSVHFILSTALDGKIKVWLYDTSTYKIDYDAPGGWCTAMAYSADGKRIFACGTSQNGETYLVEWIECEGGIMRSYHGLRKYAIGTVQFDITQNCLLAAGDDHMIKFWDSDDESLLMTLDAGGGLPATPGIRFNKEGTLLAVSANDNGVKILATPDGAKLLLSDENPSLSALRVESETASKNGEIQDWEGVNAGLREGNKTTKTLMIREFNRPSQIGSLEIPVSLKINKISRLMYTHSGKGIIALASNAMHLQWRWPQNNLNVDGKASVKYVPHVWQPASGIQMTNDLADAKPEVAIPCFALSRNGSYLISTSGGQISLFNMFTFKTMMAFMRPPPVATYLVFHPQDNNIVVIGMDDSSIQIYDVRMSQVKAKLLGHSKRITGLAFSSVLDTLVSSGADAQIIVWQSKEWASLRRSFLQTPACSTLFDTFIQFHQDQIHFLAIHEARLAIYETTKLECVKQWVVPESSAPICDATFSCDSQLVYACFFDGAVVIFYASSLQPHCRINPISYISESVSSATVHPTAIAANPTESNQFALGFSDARVYIFEPLESEGQWVVPSLVENGSPSNISTAPAVPGSSLARSHELD